ncbi:MAG TPA: hypothetical protein VF519_10470, partial [Mycobacteriales bacterium]
MTDDDITHPGDAPDREPRHTARDKAAAELSVGLAGVGKSIDPSRLGEMAKALDTASIIGKIDHTALDAIAANLGGGLDIVG